jgi:hypothetical protein
MVKSDKVGSQEKVDVCVRHDAERCQGLGTHNLKLDSLAFELNSANLEVDANCRYVAFCVGIVCKTEEEARLETRLSLKDFELIGRPNLPDAGVTDEKEFEEVVVLAGVHVADELCLRE